MPFFFFFFPPIHPLDSPKHHKLALNTSIRQGQTQYNYLIFNFDDTDELKLTLSLTEQEIAAKYAGKLKREYDGTAHSVFTSTLSGISGKAITTVGDNPFVNDNDQKFVQCTIKTNRGFLYPLRKAFLFVSKVPVYISYSQVRKIEISGYDIFFCENSFNSRVVFFLKKKLQRRANVDSV